MIEASGSGYVSLLWLIETTDNVSDSNIINHAAVYFLKNASIEIARRRYRNPS